MVDLYKTSLDNGLRVIIAPEDSTPLLTLNILYDTGSKDEDPRRTGFAHLFEHLMFGGTVNIPSYDKPLQTVGGENNAFTNTDITNYYVTVPAQNIETALWLESDRMLGLDFSQEKLDIQKNVVIEEFKQRYLNQPYGDAMLLLRPLAFQSHPYQWPTIGRDISHIERAELGEVKDFFKAHYAPNNAILVLGGKIGQEKGIHLIKKWFDDIPPAVISPRDLEPEPGQQESRNLRVTRDVPYDAIYKAYHMPGRAAEGFHTCDLISDILANGKSSRLYQSLVKEKRIFSDINAYVSGEIDPGLFFVSGKIMAGNSLQDADESIQEILNMISRNVVGEKELQKVKNKVESALVFSESNVLARSINLALYELLGDAEKINVEMGEYNRVDRAMIGSWAAKLFRPENTSTLYYQSTEQKSS